MDDPSCQVCGEGLSLRPVVSCTGCETPHHRECWGYLGGCSTFGCGAQAAHTGMPRAGSSLVVSGDVVEVVRAPMLNVAVERSWADRRASLVPAAGRSLAYGTLALGILSGIGLLLRLANDLAPLVFPLGAALFGLVQSFIVWFQLSRAGAMTGELTLDRETGVVTGRFGAHHLTAQLSPGTRAFVTRTPEGQLAVDLRGVLLGHGTAGLSNRSLPPAPLTLRIAPPVPEHSSAAAALLTFAAAVARHVGTPLEHRSAEPKRAGQSASRHLPARARPLPRLGRRDSGEEGGTDAE